MNDEEHNTKPPWTELPLLNRIGYLFGIPWVLFRGFVITVFVLVPAFGFYVYTFANAREVFWGLLGLCTLFVGLLYVATVIQRHFPK